MLQHWPEDELWHSLALLPACHGVWQELRGISRSDAALRASREELSQVVRHVNARQEDTPASQLRAARQIKLRAEEVLQLFGADERVLGQDEPDYGRGTAPQEARGWSAASRVNA